jgi:hypothetical protein
MHTSASIVREDNQPAEGKVAVYYRVFSSENESDLWSRRRVYLIPPKPRGIESDRNDKGSWFRHKRHEIAVAVPVSGPVQTIHRS